MSQDVPGKVLTCSSETELTAKWQHQIYEKPYFSLASKVETFLETFYFGPDFLHSPCPTRTKPCRPKSPPSTLQCRLTLCSLLRFNGCCINSTILMKFACTNNWASPAKSSNYFVLITQMFNGINAVQVDAFLININHHNIHKWPLQHLVQERKQVKMLQCCKDT